MTFRARFLLATAIWMGLVTAAHLVIVLAYRTRLPEPTATHWGPGGAPDDSMPFWGFAAIGLVLWLLIGLPSLGFAIRGSVLRRRQARAWVGAVLSGGGFFVLGLTTLTVWANLDVGHWRAARPIGWQVLAVIALAAIAGWLGWLVTCRGPHDPPNPPIRRLPAVRLRPGEKAVWVSSASNPALIAVSSAALFLAVMLALAMALGLPSWGWSVVGALAATGLACLLASSLGVHVGGQGLVIAFGPLRWPVRRVPLGKIDRAWGEERQPSQCGGWGYRGLPGNATIMVRGGPCLVVRYVSGGELGISVDDPDRGAALLNTFIGERTQTG
jgi:hypothetical protein